MFYVILTISYLRAQTTETSSLPTDSSRPLFKQIEILYGCIFQLSVLSLRVTKVPPRLGEIPAGAINEGVGVFVNVFCHFLIKLISVYV